MEDYAEYPKDSLRRCDYSTVLVPSIMVCANQANDVLSFIHNHFIHVGTPAQEVIPELEF